MTDTTTTTLTDFLLARVAEDETQARMAEDGTGDHEPELCSYCDAARAVPNPARVLAECDAKRRIVTLHSYPMPLCEWTQDSNNVHETDETCDTLRCLALPYATHPDYRQEWAL